MKVWTERRSGVWDQCTECAYLMTLVYGGFDAFPLGAYTAPERDALDAAGEPDPPGGGSTFTIIDRGALSRYGLKLRQIPDGSRAGLTRELSRVGQALALAGSYRGLSAGHTLRRWQPGFVGGHAVCVIVEGVNRLRWLDPLAPAGYIGDITDVSTALAFAWVPNDARVATAGELEEPLMNVKPGAIKGIDTPCTVRLAKGKPIFSAPGGTSSPLPYDFGATAIGVTDSGYGAYLLNSGGVKYFRLVDVASAASLAAPQEQIIAKIRTLVG